MKNTFFIALFLAIFIAAGVFAGERKSLRVGVRPAAPPFCFISKKGDEVGLRGINIDIMVQIERYLKVRMKYISCTGIEQRQQWLTEGHIDVMALVTSEESKSGDIRYIPVDLSLNRRLFVHESRKNIVCCRDLGTSRVVTITGDSYQPFVNDVEEKNLIVVQTPLEALQLLDKGLVDAYLAPSELIALYLIQTEKLEHVVRVGMVLETIPLAMGIRADDQQLFEALTMAMERITRSGTMQLIKDKWYGVSLKPPSWRIYTRAIIISLSAVVFIILVVFAWNFQLKRKVRKITKDLQTSEKKYRDLIENSPDMIFVVDRAGRIEIANKEARGIMSDFFYENKKHYLAELVVPVEKVELEEFLATVFEDQNGSRPFHFLSTNDEVRDMDVAAMRIPTDVTAEEDMVCFFARDVTERKRIEQELIQADRLATIGKMAAGVAHEINNPIGIMRTNIEFIQARGWFAAEAREFVESIRRNTLRAGKITQDLLAISRPKTPEMTEVDLSQLVDLTLAILSHQLKHIEVDFIKSRIPVFVKGDRNLLQQVLVNVFLNAIAAMKDIPGKKILITFCAPPGEGATCLRIEDSGRGIPRKHLNEIFEPFFTFGKKEGFGLGLFICRRIIENHDGMIFAESEEGRGAQIIIELPLVEDKDQTSVRTFIGEVMDETQNIDNR
ncbi:MAG: transporter substrate-binding domain-containing protein [Deltaproteobacteria bacterium]|nr:transporter substrate-binding domain-containing protein [Deltaproteobacteria bacterium]